MKKYHAGRKEKLIRKYHCITNQCRKVGRTKLYNPALFAFVQLDESNNKVATSVFLYPTYIGIFLLKFVRLLLPLCRNLTMFDASILFPSVAFFRNRANAGINELPLTCKQTFVVEVPIESMEYSLSMIFLFESVSRNNQRVFAPGSVSSKSQPRKTHEL